MIKRKGDLFTTDAQAIGHGVNCEGVMGAGIALEFKKRWPNNFRRYKDWCDRNMLFGGKIVTSYILGETDAKDLFIVNMATQYAPGPNARLEYIYAAGLAAMTEVEQMRIDRIAIPMIGCGIGGLQWGAVEEALRDLENHFNVQWEVWKYE